MDASLWNIGIKVEDIDAEISFFEELGAKLLRPWLTHKGRWGPSPCAAGVWWDASVSDAETGLSGCTQSSAHAGTDPCGI